MLPHSNPHFKNLSKHILPCVRIVTLKVCPIKTWHLITFHCSNPRHKSTIEASIVRPLTLTTTTCFSTESKGKCNSADDEQKRDATTIDEAMSSNFQPPWLKCGNSSKHTSHRHKSFSSTSGLSWLSDLFGLSGLFGSSDPSISLDLILDFGLM